MIHPSYNELIDIINEGNENGENPQINSRYSIVMAAAKRARQLIAGEDPLVSKAPTNKPLSVAVEEIRSGKVKITEEGVDDFQFHLRSSENNASNLVYDEDADQAEGESEGGEMDAESEDDDYDEEDEENDVIDDIEDGDAE